MIVIYKDAACKYIVYGHEQPTPSSNECQQDKKVVSIRDCVLSVLTSCAGTEAMFADLGHFTAMSIRVSLDN